MWNSRRPQAFISSGPTRTAMSRDSSQSASKFETPMLKLAFLARCRLSFSTRLKQI
jgi:hypothetical protein